MKMLREDDPDLGQITDLAKTGDTPEDKRPKCSSDLRYKKIDGFYPGATHLQTRLITILCVFGQFDVIYDVWL